MESFSQFQTLTFSGTTYRLKGNVYNLLLKEKLKIGKSDSRGHKVDFRKKFSLCNAKIQIGETF